LPGGLDFSIDAVCNQAYEALADLKDASEEYIQWYAKLHGVDPLQVQLFIQDKEMKVEPMIRPYLKGSHRCW
jgi:hypothetical protein